MPTKEEDKAALENPDDAFNEAFDIAEKAITPELSPGDDPKNFKEEEPQEAKEEAKVEESAAEPVKEEDEPAKEEKEVASDVAVAQRKDESDEAYEQRWKTLQGIHNSDKVKWAEEKAQLLADLEAAKKVKEEKEEETVEALTDEYEEAIAKYDLEFDTVSQMEAIKRQRELKALEKRVFDKIAELDTRTADLQTRTEPMIKRAAVDEVAAHFGAIEAVHADYGKYVDDGSIQKWIDAGPSYLMGQRQAVYDKGKVEEAIELIDDFKHETNIIKLPKDDGSNVVNIRSKSAAKREALESIESRKGAVNVNQRVADDFDSAFDEAISKGG